MSAQIDTLARQLASSKNNVYAATMSDGPVESIHRAERQRDEVKAEILALGIEPDTLIEWSDRHGCWKAKP